MIVLDASVLIAYLDADDAHHQRATQLLEREVDEDFALNPLTLAEILVGPMRSGRLERAVEVLRELQVMERPFPPEATPRLAQIRTLTGLRMPDCCVLFTAEEASARVATFDTALTNAAVGLGLATVVS